MVALSANRLYAEYKHFNYNTMKKIYANIKSTVCCLVATLLLSSPMVSCSYDDIWNEINNIKEELAELRESLQTELNALKELVNGSITIKDVAQQADGSKVLTLSDGSKITIYPKGDKVPANIITTTTVDGVLCWAYYDGLGQAQPILVGGKTIPVAEMAPITQITDGVIEVSFDGGKTWILTGYDESTVSSIIVDVKVVYSDWQTDADGNLVPLYCELTLVDGSTVKVGMQNGKIIVPFDSLFVPYGMDVPISIEISDVADYMTTTPKGWECDVQHNVKQGNMILNFTAPTYEEVAAGSAVSSGVAKMMVVFNNGSSAIASIKLTTNPANIYFAPEGLYVEVGYGTNYMLCGLVSAGSFNGTTYTTACNQMLSGGSASSSIHELSFMEENTEYVLYTDLRSTALKAGSEYSFWYVVPRTDENGDMYVVAEEFCVETFKYSTVEFEVVETSYFDVTINFNVAGSEGYMLGYTKAEEFDAAELAEFYTEHPDYLNATKTDVEYLGSFTAMFDINAANLQEDTDYVAWYIAKSRNGVIIVDNVLNWPFSTNAFEQGGTIEVQCVGDAKVEYEYVELTLDTEEEHIAFFYNAMPSYMASAYPDDSYVIDMLVNEGVKKVSTESVVARYDGAKPGDKLTFFAVAVDNEGKFGKVFKQEYTTRKIEYSALTLEATLVDYKIDNTRVLVECEGAVAYRYVYARTDDEKVWTNRYGGSEKLAGEFMIKNLDASDVYNTANEKYALVDGHICLSGLTSGEEYVIVVAAVDAEGKLTAPKALYFSPIANIGVVVTREGNEAAWEVGKPTITVLNFEDNPLLFYQFAWLFTPGERTTAYSAAMFPANFVNADLGTNIDTVEKLIADIITSCDTGTMSEQGKSCEWNESGIYIRRWTEWEDTDGDGYLEAVEKSEEHPGGYHFFPYGSSGNTYIYTTWVGEDGNFHEPFAIDAKTGKEVDIWTGAIIE